jgi:hypothetical protein
MPRRRKPASQPQSPPPASQAGALNNLEQQVHDHWLKYRPKMCQALKRAGKFDQAVETAAELTQGLLSKLLAKGLDYNQSEEIAYREWMLLPDEQEVPKLPFDPAALQPPDVAA